MKHLIKFIIILTLGIAIVTTHVYVASTFYLRGDKAGYERGQEEGNKRGYDKGVADSAYYMYTICTRESNVYFNGDPTGYYCAPAVKL